MKSIFTYCLLIIIISPVSSLKAQCVNPSLIDPSVDCLGYSPVCGCDTRTYRNACIAASEGGVTEYTQGACPITETYVICPGDNVQIGLPGGIGNALPTWNPSNTLSCTNCFSATAAPTYSTIYELKIFTTLDFSTQYYYFEVNVTHQCNCEHGEVRLPYYLYTEGTADDPQSQASAFYSWNVNWPSQWCEFYWDFGNGQTSTDPNPQEIGFPVIQNTISITEPYNICLTIEDCAGNMVNDCCVNFYPEGFQTCLLPPDGGPCDGICYAWYYNSTIQDCIEFEYGCCAGNANNFDTYQMCITSCEGTNGCGSDLAWLELPTCDSCYDSAELIEYNGTTYIAFWQDDFACVDAISVVYNCDGTVFCYQNGEAGFQQCSNLIDNYIVLETLWDKQSDCDTCFLPPNPGPCLASNLRYYYNPFSQTCETFTWGGCGGNGNKYTTFETCMEACGQFGCPPMINLGSVPLNTIDYQVQERIIYGGGINANQQVRFKAGKRVTIESGFSVPQNSKFKAYIEPCN